MPHISVFTRSETVPSASPLPPTPSSVTLPADPLRLGTQHPGPVTLFRPPWLALDPVPSVSVPQRGPAGLICVFASVQASPGQCPWALCQASWILPLSSRRAGPSLSALLCTQLGTGQSSRKGHSQCGPQRPPPGQVPNPGHLWTLAAAVRGQTWAAGLGVCRCEGSMRAPDVCT